MADTDILTLEEGRAAIGAPDDQTYDDELERAITAITALIETRVGPVVIRTITDELHQGGGYSIRPYKRPVSTVTTVVEAQGTTQVTLSAEAFGATPANGYYYDQTTGDLWRRSGGYSIPFWCGGQSVKITYEAGRYDDTESVDPRFKEAAAIALAHNWGLDRGSGNQTFGAFDGGDGTFGRGFALPNRSLEILADDRRVPGIA